MGIWLNYNSASSNIVAYPKRITEGHKSLWRVDGTGEWMGICRQVLVSYSLNMIHIRPICPETNKMISPLYGSAIPGMTGGNIWTSTYIYKTTGYIIISRIFFLRFWAADQRSSYVVTRSEFDAYFLLTLWCEAIPKKLKVIQLLKKFPRILLQDDLLLCSPDSVTSSCFELH
jgi:hypothetical protein